MNNENCQLRLLQKNIDEVIAKAKLHNKASRNRKETKDEKIVFCECCGLVANSQKIPILCPVNDLQVFGIGIYFYFKNVQFLLILTVLGIIFVAVPCSIDNLTGSGGLTADPSTWPEELSIQREKAAGWQSLCCFFYALVIIFSLNIWKKFVYGKKLSLPFMKKKASSFAVVFKNIPKRLDFQEFQLFLNEKSKEFQLEVTEVSPVFKVNDLVKAMNRLESIQREISKLNEFGESGQKNKKWKKLEEEKEKIDSFCQKFFEREKIESCRTDIAIVSFKKHYHRDFVLNHWKVNKIQNLCLSIFNYCPKVAKNSRFYFKSRLIRINPAPEPTDLIWSNLSLNPYVKCLKYLLFTLIISFLLCFGCILLIIFYEGKSAYEASSGSSKSSHKLVSFLLSLLISLFNYILCQSIKHLSSLQSSSTQSELTLSIFKSQSIVTILNTLISLSLVSSKDQDMYTKHSKLPLTVSNLLMINAFLIPFLEYFDFSYLYKKFLRWRIKSLKFKVNQIEANQVWTNPQLEVAERSVKYMNIFTLALMTSPVYPFALIQVLLPLGINYWVDKFLFLRRHGRSFEINQKLIKLFLKFISFALFLFLVMIMQTIASDVLRKGVIHSETDLLFVNSVAFIVFFLFCCLPCKVWIKKCCSKKDSRTRFEEDYWEMKKEFSSDYSRSNPALKFIRCEEFQDDFKVN